MYREKSYAKMYSCMGNSNQSIVETPKIVSQMSISSNLIDPCNSKKEINYRADNARNDLKTPPSVPINKNSNVSIKQNGFKLGKEAFKELPTVQIAKEKEMKNTVGLLTKNDQNRHSVNQNHSTCNQKQIDNIGVGAKNISPDRPSINPSRDKSENFSANQPMLECQGTPTTQKSMAHQFSQLNSHVYSYPPFHSEQTYDKIQRGHVHQPSNVHKAPSSKRHYSQLPYTRQMPLSNQFQYSQQQSRSNQPLIENQPSFSKLPSLENKPPCNIRSLGNKLFNPNPYTSKIFNANQALLVSQSLPVANRTHNATQNSYSNQLLDPNQSSYENKKHYQEPVIHTQYPSNDNQRYIEKERSYGNQLTGNMQQSSVRSYANQQFCESQQPNVKPQFDICQQAFAEPQLSEPPQFCANQPTKANKQNAVIETDKGNDLNVMKSPSEIRNQTPNSSNASLDQCNKLVVSTTNNQQMTSEILCHPNTQILETSRYQGHELPSSSVVNQGLMIPNSVSFEHNESNKEVNTLCDKTNVEIENNFKIKDDYDSKPEEKKLNELPCLLNIKFNHPHAENDILQNVNKASGNNIMPNNNIQSIDIPCNDNEIDVIKKKDFTPTLRTSVTFGKQPKVGPNLGEVSCAGPLNKPYGFDRRLPNTFNRPVRPASGQHLKFFPPRYNTPEFASNLQGARFSNVTNNPGITAHSGVQYQGPSLNPTAYIEQIDNNLVHNGSMPNIGAECQQAQKSEAAMPNYSSTYNTTLPDNSIPLETEKLSCHKNTESVNIGSQYTSEQIYNSIGNSNYGLQEQQSYDTSVLVQMYAPSAATGWYAEQPPNNKERIIEYHSPDTSKSNYQYENINQQPNYPDSTKTLIPQPPQPPPSGADSESWKAYGQMMAKYWSHWSSQSEPT